MLGTRIVYIYFTFCAHSCDQFRLPEIRLHPRIEVIVTRAPRTSFTATGRHVTQAHVAQVQHRGVDGRRVHGNLWRGGAVTHQILMTGTLVYNNSRCRDTSDSDHWRTWLQQQVP